MTSYTTGTIAKQLGVKLWQVRRMFELGLVPEPPRVGKYRYVPARDVPKVRRALQETGYLPADNDKAG